MNSGAREALTYAASLMHVSVEDVLTVGVDSVSDARDSAIRSDGNLLGSRGSSTSGVTAAEVVLNNGVRPVSLDGSIAVVGALHKIHYLTVLSALSKHIYDNIEQIIVAKIISVVSPRYG